MMLLAATAHTKPMRHVNRHIHHISHGHLAASPAFTIGGVIAVIAFVVGLLFLIIFLARIRTKAALASKAAAQAHFDAVASGPLTPMSVPELSLQSRELAYYCGEASVLGTHTMTRRVGYSGGPSFRIAKGVYYHASSFSSTPVRETFTAQDDTGQLIVTNQRVLFVGSHNSWSWPLDKILSIHRFTDGVQVNPINKKAVVFTTGTEDAGIIMDRARAGSLRPSAQSSQGQTSS